jgi:predicted transposase/invertase (TIGR01784 family)
MDEERLNPLNDYLFMKYMGEKGDEEQLIAFLNVVLQKTRKDKVASVTILENKFMSAEIVGDKANVLDIRAEMNDGSRVNIEVQLRDVSNMDRRSLFYWGREYVEGIKSGGKYRDLPNVININILGTSFLAIDDVHASFHLWEDTHKDYLLTDALEIHFIDMIKFHQLKSKDIVNNGLHRWLTFFDNETSSETIIKIIAMDTAIKKAQEKIMYVAQDRDMLHAYRMREMAIYDYNNGISAAEERGIAIGEKRGEKRGVVIGEKRGVAIGEKRGDLERSIISTINLKNAGFSAQEIANFIGKTTDDVIKIFEEQGLA